MSDHLWEFGDGHTGWPEPPSSDDTWIACIDCGGEFVFTAGERRFFASRNFATPFRCRPCRLVRRAAREQQGAP
jgi:hypothetical protein